MSTRRTRAVSLIATTLILMSLGLPATASYLSRCDQASYIRIHDLHQAPDEGAQTAMLIATYKRAQRECRLAEEAFTDAVCTIEMIDFNNGTRVSGPGWFVGINLRLCRPSARTEVKE